MAVGVAAAVVGILGGVMAVPVGAYWFARRDMPVILRVLVVTLAIPLELLLLVWSMYLMPVILDR